MNWDAIGAVGQMLGSLAVFTTLGYLAVQLRQTRAEVKRSISQGRAGSNREMAMYRASNEQISDIFARAHQELGGESALFMVKLKERTGLTPVKAARLFWDQLAFWVDRTLTVSVIDALPAGERTQFEIHIRNSYGSNASPVSRLWYETTKAALNPDVVRYIDNLLAQPA